ncbi:MAG: hypothetical protein ACHQVK_04120 [Candidatus Paceibacterales bacterium]
MPLMIAMLQRLAPGFVNVIDTRYGPRMVQFPFGYDRLLGGLSKSMNAIGQVIPHRLPVRVRVLGCKTPSLGHKKD